MTNSGGNQGELLRGGGSNEPRKEGLRTGEEKEKGVLGGGSSIFQSPGYRSLLCRDPQGPEPWQLSDLTAASCFSVDPKAVDVSVHLISAINTRVMLRSKCFQAGAYLLAANICGVKESTAGDGDAVSNLITFLLPGGWVSVMNPGL